MTGYYKASNAFTFLILLTGASFLHPSSSSPINTQVDVESAVRNAPVGQMVSGDGERRDEERRSLQQEETEEDELFKDVDPKTLAAVLLEALNHSQLERRREGDEYALVEGDSKAVKEEVQKEQEYRNVRTMEGANRDRDGRQEFELLMATQGKEQEKKEEEERRKAQREEEMMTEKVTSHTTSQTVKVQTEQQSTSPDERGENKGATLQGPVSREQGSNEEEEQLSPEELKSLETMMKEFPRLNTATKREGDSEQNQRESRGYSNYNEIIPINEGGNLAMSKKKLKWQEETQKALHFPTFKGGNFMDDVDDNNNGKYAAQSQPPAEQMDTEGNELKEEEEDEDVLSPEEEEARAKAEQEEMRRQAAEAQRAKMEEEKLADIASDMLLRYMVKQNNGNKKYSSTLSNAAEDKRSNEEQEVTEEDDIDPQTIDKLIEISSKLHLPADDVVDIISDVEKKKKKDVPLETMSLWQKPRTSLSSLLSSTNGFSGSHISDKENHTISKQPSLSANHMKTWFQEKMPTESQDYWGVPAKPQLVKPNIWPKPQKPVSVKPNLWLKSPKSFWTGYQSYPYTYPSYYQSYPNNYPMYFSPPLRAKPQYYIHKPALNLKSLLRNSVSDTYTPIRRYHSWMKPWLRKPPASLQHNTYYTRYPIPQYPWTFQPVPVSKQHSLPRLPVVSSHQKPFYYSALAPAVTRNNYFVSGKQTNDSNHKDLEKYIQKILMKRPQMN